MTGPEGRIRWARRAGLSWFVGFIVVTVVAVVLDEVAGANHPAARILHGFGLFCAVFAASRLGWARGYRERLDEERP